MRNAIKEDEILDESEMKEGPSNEDLRKIADVSREQVKLVREKEKLEQQLADVNKRLQANMQVELPEIMLKCGMESYTLAGGYSVSVDKIVKASIPAPDNKRVENAAHKHAIGIAYMDKMAPDLVKNSITIEYPKGQEKLFKKFMRDLAQRKIPVDYKLTRAVHASTLSKWVRTRLDKAEDVDEVALNVHKVTIAEVKIPRKEKLDA